MAINMNITVPWVMCAQQDAPDPIVSAISLVKPSFMRYEMLTKCAIVFCMLPALLIC